MTNEGVSFVAIFTQARTTPDGGWQITFSISQDQANQMLILSNFRDQLLSLGVIPVDQSDSGPSLDFDIKL